jgi:hypothetical protein
MIFGKAIREARVWMAIRIYFVTPALVLLAAAEVFVRLTRAHEAIRAKLHHGQFTSCIFRCGYARTAGQKQRAVASGA